MQKNGERKTRINRGQDRMSLLPDHLLSQILLNLPTKDIVKTSVLSTRWRSVWLSVPGLDLSLTRLKTLRLEEFSFTNHKGIETLTVSCPVLDDLSIVRSQDDVKVLRVCSEKINRLNHVLGFTDIWGIEDIDEWKVVIDAPRINFLSLRNNQPPCFTINSLYSPSKVDIAIDFNVKDVLNPNDSAKRSCIGNFLKWISCVRDMTISWKTLKVIHQYSKLEPLPQFCNLSKLHAKIFATDMKMFPDLLERCPNLKSLVLEQNGSINKKEQISFSTVPRCLRSSLESFEMKEPIGGIGVEMELIRYFLENSTVLKTLTLRWDSPTMKEESIMFKELLRFRRCSSMCQVVVVGLEETLMKL